MYNRYLPPDEAYAPLPGGGEPQAPGPVREARRGPQGAQSAQNRPGGDGKPPFSLSALLSGAGGLLGGLGAGGLDRGDLLLILILLLLLWEEDDLELVIALGLVLLLGLGDGKGQRGGGCPPP